MAMAAMARLREAGYPFLEREVSVSVGGRNRRFDLVAYSPDKAGELYPAAVVEVKRHLDRPSTAASALTQLALARELLGVHDCYAYDGQWYEPDPSFSKLRSVADPARLTATGVGDLEPVSAQTHDVELVVRALERWIQSRTSSVQGERLVNQLEVIADALDELLDAGSGVLRDSLSGIWVPAEVLWRAARRLVEGAARTQSGGGDAVVPVDIRRALVNLSCPEDFFELDGRDESVLGSSAGGTVADPFCGLGLLLCDFLDALWESKLQPQSRNPALLLYGSDPNPLCVRIAETLLRLAPPIHGFKKMVIIEVSDGAIDGRSWAARVLISAPPFGRRLPVAVPTRAGSTRNGDEAQIDRCARSLQRGGRAVVLTSQRWLSSGEATTFRHSLAKEVDIPAIIGLPPRALGSLVGIPAAITILKRGEPSGSLVADLEEDWAQQLSVSGDFYRAYLARLSDVHE